MTAPQQRPGIILFAHGSRDPLWHKPMEAVAARLKELSPLTPVQCAYLELSTPDIAQATLELTNAGVNAITIVPLFLGVGKHAREDLPLLVAGLRAQHPQVQFSLQGAVGESPRLVHLLAEIALEGLKP
ncbi:sirohydrochlorin chelatase [Rhodoferax saidenbachensis]|uniref:Cobalamin biosynthesis protein CbiX n=1 Tax=Rhodoferax saidenbachensis TaxID=1484693 RepID=A0A1P8KA00_9BURK|nr:CbiX/SirB N-terminal domain-containing protein [Rhodoferax saidenbachensis]APW42841.1 cobalamin biosynthesis protein CbiX [Rhodoferax saidenbachensis]